MAERGLRTFDATSGLQFTTEGRQMMYMGNVIRVHPLTAQSYFVPFPGMVPDGSFTVCASIGHFAYAVGGTPKVTIVNDGFNVAIAPPIEDGSLTNNALYDIWSG